jgi:hypothetical protein
MPDFYYAIAYGFHIFLILLKPVVDKKTKQKR